jgi:hypothetical protein
LTFSITFDAENTALDSSCKWRNSHALKFSRYDSTNGSPDQQEKAEDVGSEGPATGQASANPLHDQLYDFKFVFYKHTPAE